MKVHFMGAVDGNQDNYKKIVEKIIASGHELVTTHFLERSIDEIQQESPAESELYAKKSHKWIRLADIVIVETSRTDVSIGYEIALAMNMMKPVIVLYHKDSPNIPFSLKGVNSDKLQVLSYNDDTLGEMLGLALDYASETSDVRFNFFISPSIGLYLDWISKHKKIPRSVYLRTLIERDMAENEEYHAD
jgi:hypothetical protein